MKQKDSEILSQLGKEAGFKVPEHYFDDFSKNLMEKLPEVKISEVPKPSLWDRYKTYVYMAAMFAGIWCMAKIFTLNTGAGGAGKTPAQMAAGVQDVKDESVDDMSQDDNGDKIMTYEDSVKSGISAEKTEIEK